MGDGAEKGLPNFAAEAVYDAQGQMDKAAVFPVPFFPADHQALHDPAAEAVYKKGVDYVGTGMGALKKGKGKMKHGWNLLVEAGVAIGWDPGQVYLFF